MKLLIDTHVLLWASEDAPRLGEAARAALKDTANDVRLSVASLWEIAIKRAAGKLDAPENLPQVVKQMSIAMLPISADHAWAVGELPPIHGDPFDRLMIAQAKLEGMTFVTHDKRLVDYGGAIWVI